MLGQMMQQALLISSLLQHAERHHGKQEIVSRRTEGDIHRYTFVEMAARSRRLAKALRELGVDAGERAGTLAWTGYRHLELYFAASGSGAVLHTLNPRLHPDQLAWIIEHAQDLGCLTNTIGKTATVLSWTKFLWGRPGRC
ncbi:AMP-binding protein [Cupriavidus sp. TMH.W2]|uniref:AMP-binding protein n=1 Tax=Cupriavidus sp. TMH.W2 TaxID=3434465 RepID=UPI003D77754B